MLPVQIGVVCPDCRVRVSAKVLAAHETHTEEDRVAWIEEGNWEYADGPPYHYPMRGILLLCPACKGFILGIQGSTAMDDPKWSDLEIVYPPSKLLTLPGEIPSQIRDSLREAQLCIEIGATQAAVTMVGRAVEGVCRHSKTRNPFLGGCLQELKDREIIDKRLFEWGQEVHWHRNVTAHADPAATTITAEDAKDLFDFAVAICQYVFALAGKFEKFKQRREEARSRGG
jgi:hypothetical protein